MFDVLPLPFMFGLNALQSSPSGAEVDLTNTTHQCPSSGTLPAGCTSFDPLSGQPCSKAAITAAVPGCPLAQGTFISGLGPAAAGVSAAGTGRWQYTDRNPKRNYVMQWNFNVQTANYVEFVNNRCLCWIKGNSQSIPDRHTQHVLSDEDFSRMVISDSVNCE